MAAESLLKTVEKKGKSPRKYNGTLWTHLKINSSEDFYWREKMPTIPFNWKHFRYKGAYIYLYAPHIHMGVYMYIK